jgi:flagellar basal-body rod modification protein FlgD
MIGVKTGTQTWSTSQQRADFKSDGTQTISATDKQKIGGEGDAIGDILNKVADPNYIDDAKKMRTVGNKEMGKDAFMTLLLTQMKNQDPNNPLKSHEMAAQLAQFTSLEKLHNINDAIEGLRKDQKPDQNFQALNFIGRSITTDNSKIGRVDASDHHQIRFSLPNDGSTVKLQIKDAAGAVARTLEYKNLKSGKNELNWNGMTDDGRPAPVGDYTASIEALGNNGRKLAVELKSEGVITGVNFTPKGPQLLIGKQVVNMADVKSISDPVASQMQELATPRVPVTQANAPAGPKMIEVKPETKDNADKAAKLKKGDLNDAAMAQGLINRLNKEGAKAGGMGG